MYTCFYIYLLIVNIGAVTSTDKQSRQLGTEDFPHFDNGDMVRLSGCNYCMTLIEFFFWGMRSSDMLITSASRWSFTTLRAFSLSRLRIILSRILVSLISCAF